MYFLYVLYIRTYAQTLSESAGFLPRYLLYFVLGCCPNGTIIGFHFDHSSLTTITVTITAAAIATATVTVHNVKCDHTTAVAMIFTVF